MKRGHAIIIAFVAIALLLLVPLALSWKPKWFSRQFWRRVACNDGIDNDGDGYTDYPADPGCKRRWDRSELNRFIECDDGIDNDGDGYIDRSDAGCSSPRDNDESNCGDGICEGGETHQTCSADCTPPDSCSETDSGFDIWNQGSTYGYRNGNAYNNTDFCDNSTSLIEYYCSGTSCSMAGVDCSNYNATCNNGACQLQPQ
ncbi:hypothetical protein DRN74_02765 [Candidatus Micrarchaeota archaeon]|nr:MAG: hypothetical protein DRN74_02765 [Candidatus Micrarchaeota archaeon]